MRISATNQAAMGRVAPREEGAGAIDSQIKKLEKRREKLQKELKDAGNPKEIERIAKEIQIVQMEIITLKAARENLAGNAKQQSAAEEVGRDRYEDAVLGGGVEKADAAGPEGTPVSDPVNDASEHFGGLAGDMPPLLGKRPGIYTLEVNGEGRYAVVYELEADKEERRADERGPRRSP